MSLMTLAILRSLVWLFLILTVGLGSTSIVANAVVASQAKNQRVFIVRDGIGAGSHTLSGTIPVSSSCEEVTVTTERTSSTTYALRFKTWKEPSIPTCADQEATRQFHAVVFASSYGITFGATVNGEPIRIAVIEDVPIKK